MRPGLEPAERAHLSPRLQTEVETFMQFYLTYLLERRLNSPDFLNHIRE